MNIKIDPVEYDNIAKLYKDGKTQKEISIICFNSWNRKYMK